MKSQIRTNKILSRLALFGAIAMGFLSCSKEDAQLAQEQENIDNKLATITITAQSGESDGSKTVVGGDDFNKVYWNAQEKISVFNLQNSTNNMFTSTNTSVSSISNFTGTIEGITDPSQLDGKQVIGLYPYNANAAIDASGVVTTTLPAFQTAVDDTFADNLYISLGKSTTNATNMKFYNVCSGLCFTVSHEDIKTVVLRGANGEILAGDFKVKFATVEGKEIPVIQSVGSYFGNGSSNIITVEAPNGGTFVPGKRYYVVSLTQSLPNGLIIEGFRADGTVYTNTINKNVTLKRAVFARKTNFDSGLTAQDLYDYTLTVTPPGVFPYTGGTHGWENPDPNKQGMRVASYRTLKSDPTKTFPVAWKSQITTDDGATWNDLTEDNKSTYGAGWLTLSHYFDINTTSPTGERDYPVTADVAVSGTVNLENIHTMALKAGKHPSGTDNSTKANAIDLSMYDLEGNDISQTTANCYIVNAPGWYKFPMVYGNAIKNGTTNTNAFTSTVTQNSDNKGRDVVLMNFVDHNGANITQPWVTNAHSGGAYSISKAELVWQDAQSLVTDITIGNSGSNTDYIYFYVDQNTIHQGNAVIAAYVGSTVAWSWHIWVTDQEMTSIPVKNYQGVTYDFLPVNLGWSDVGTNTGYAARMADIRIVQTIGTKTADCDIIQNGYCDKQEMGNNPYYQHGRKDPMQPVLMNQWQSSKPCYDKDGQFIGSARPNSVDRTTITAKLSDVNNGISGTVVIKNWIQNPFVFDIGQYGTGQYINLWSANENHTVAQPKDNIVVKTVYDPSPIDYSLPASNAFTGFSKTGQETTSETQINYITKGDYGYYFKTNIGDATIYFPSMSHRNSTEGVAPNQMNMLYTGYGYYSSSGCTYYHPYYSYYLDNDRVIYFIFYRKGSSSPYEGYVNPTQLQHIGVGMSVRPVLEK